MIPMDDETRNRLNAEHAKFERRLTELLGLTDTAVPGIHHDREGRPIGHGDWMALMDDWDYRCVALTMVGPHRVSTVWSGRAFAIAAPPLIFSTAIHTPATDRWWDYREEYTTEEAARAGHEAAVRHVEDLTGLTRTSEGG